MKRKRKAAQTPPSVPIPAMVREALEAAMALTGLAVGIAAEDEGASDRERMRNLREIAELAGTIRSGLTASLAECKRGDVRSLAEKDDHADADGAA